MLFNLQRSAVAGELRDDRALFRLRQWGIKQNRLLCVFSQDGEGVNSVGHDFLRFVILSEFGVEFR